MSNATRNRATLRPRGDLRLLDIVIPRRDKEGAVVGALFVPHDRMRSASLAALLLVVVLAVVVSAGPLVLCIAVLGVCVGRTHPLSKSRPAYILVAVLSHSAESREVGS